MYYCAYEPSFFTYQQQQNEKIKLTFLILASLSRRASEWCVQVADSVYLSSFSNLASSLCRCFTSALSDTTTLTWALVATCFAQLANERVFLDCSMWLLAGLIVQIMAVLALPPKKGCKMRVSLESRYGMCPVLPLLHKEKASDEHLNSDSKKI